MDIRDSCGMPYGVEISSTVMLYCMADVKSQLNHPIAAVGVTTLFAQWIRQEQGSCWPSRLIFLIPLGNAMRCACAGRLQFSTKLNHQPKSFASFLSMNQDHGQRELEGGGSLQVWDYAEDEVDAKVPNSIKWDVPRKSLFRSLVRHYAHS